MSEASYSLMLRNLSSDYYHNHIGFVEYRAQRKILLDKIYKEMNGTEAVDHDATKTSEVSPVFMQTIGFLKNKDIES